MPANTLTPDDVAQIIEGIEHFIMNGEPDVEALWQPYVDKLRSLAESLAQQAQRTQDTTARAGKPEGLPARRRRLTGRRRVR